MTNEQYLRLVNARQAGRNPDDHDDAGELADVRKADVMMAKVVFELSQGVLSLLERVKTLEVTLRALEVQTLQNKIDTLRASLPKAAV